MENQTKILAALIIIIIIIVLITANSETAAFIMVLIINVLVLINQLLNIDKFNKNNREEMENINNELRPENVAATYETQPAKFDDTPDKSFEGGFKYSVADDDFNVIKETYNPHLDPVLSTDPDYYNESIIDIDDGEKTVDNGMMLFERQRQKRAKEGLDGSFIKTANYYKYHFNEEGDESEDRIWWEDSFVV